MGDLFSDCIVPGVKQARPHLRLLYGTGEVIVALRVVKHQPCKKVHETMVADQIVVVLKSLKDDGAKGLTCLVSKLSDNQERDDQSS
jgi:hypothetical protein